MARRGAFQGLHHLLPPWGLLLSIPPSLLFTPFSTCHKCRESGLPPLPPLLPSLFEGVVAAPPPPFRLFPLFFFFFFNIASFHAWNGGIRTETPPEFMHECFPSDRLCQGLPSMTANGYLPASSSKIQAEGRGCVCKQKRARGMNVMHARVMGLPARNQAKYGENGKRKVACLCAS